MLQISLLREKPEFVIERLAVKNFDAKELVHLILSIDEDRRKIQNEQDGLLNQQNTLAKQVGDLYKSGQKAEADDLKNKSTALKASSQELGEKLALTEQQLHQELVKLPNLPSELVPPGKTPEDNEVVHQEGAIPKLPADAKPHWELTSKYDIIDFELGVKLTGAGFPVYKGKGARLQRALINYFLDKATEAGFREIQPPILVNRDSGYGTGQLPDKDSQMYHVQLDDFYLIPTAEVPVTNIYRDVIVKSEELPVKMCIHPMFQEGGRKLRKGCSRTESFASV